MSILHEQITQAIAKRRAVAIAASTNRNGVTTTGEHWYWGCAQHRDMLEVVITDVVLLDEFVVCPDPDCGTTLGWLVSSERYPSYDPTRPSAHCALIVKKLTPAVALHVQLNDPAAVLRQTVRDLKVLNRHREGQDICVACRDWRSADECHTGVPLLPCPDIRDLAEAYEIETGKGAL